MPSIADNTVSSNTIPSNARPSKSRKIPTREQLDEEYERMCPEVTDILSDVFDECYLGDRPAASLWGLKGTSAAPVHSARLALSSLQVMSRPPDYSSRFSDYREVIFDTIGPDNYRSTAFLYWQMLKYFEKISSYHECYCQYTGEGFCSLFVDADSADFGILVRHLNMEFAALVRVCFAPDVVRKLYNYFDKTFVDRTLIPRILKEGKESSVASLPLDSEPIFQQALAGDFTLLVDYYRTHGYSESLVIENLQLNFARAGASPTIIQEIAERYAKPEDTAAAFDEIVYFMEGRWAEMLTQSKRGRNRRAKASEADACKRDFPNKRRHFDRKHPKNSHWSKSFNKTCRPKPKTEPL